jgi:hypothetical protein
LTSLTDEGEELFRELITSAKGGRRGGNQGGEEEKDKGVAGEGRRRRRRQGGGSGGYLSALGRLVKTFAKIVATLSIQVVNSDGGGVVNGVLRW